MDRAGGGLAGSPEQQAKQAELEKATPQLKVTEEVLRLNVPGQTIGEAVGVAKNSKGHLFVFSRTGKTATVKGSAASMLFEFDQDLKFVKEWGPNNYASGFAHTVRVDKDDNVWVTDEGANMIVKYRPDGSVAMSAFGTVTYTGLEPVLVDSDVSPTDVTFNLPAGAGVAILEDDIAAVAGQLQLRAVSGSAFETTSFTVPTGNLTINATDGDTLQIASSVSAEFGISATTSP